MSVAEQYANEIPNDVTTTLNGSVDNVVTSAVVASFTGFPAQAQYRVRIENELLIVTGGAGTTTWTVTRGAEGTTAASHPSGATVTHVLTRDGLIGVGGQINLDGAYSGLPAAGVTGRVMYPSDGYHLYRDNGSVWSPWGPVLPMTLPVDGDYSWVNQGGASVDTTKGAIFLLGPAGGSDNLRLRLKTIPTAPYIVTMAFIPRFVWANFLLGGMVLRKSGTGELVTFSFRSDAIADSTRNTFVTTKWNSATSFNGDYAPTPSPFIANPFLTGPCLFLQIEDDNTSRIARVSADGKHFYPVHSVGRTDFITPDQIGFFVNANNATHSAGITVLSWVEA